MLKIKGIVKWTTFVIVFILWQVNSSYSLTILTALVATYLLVALQLIQGQTRNLTLDGTGGLDNIRVTITNTTDITDITGNGILILENGGDPVLDNKHKINNQ